MADQSCGFIACDMHGKRTRLSVKSSTNQTLATTSSSPAMQVFVNTSNTFMHGIYSMSTNQHSHYIWLVKSIKDQLPLYSSLVLLLEPPCQQKLFNLAFRQCALANEITSRIRYHWSELRVAQGLEAKSDKWAH